MEWTVFVPVLRTMFLFWSIYVCSFAVRFALQEHGNRITLPAETMANWTHFKILNKNHCWKIASHRSSIERVTLFGKPQRTLGCASLRMFEPRLSLGANLSCSAFRVRVRLGSKQYKRTKKMHKHALPRNRPFRGGKLPRSKRHGNSESKADPSKKGVEEQWNRNRRLNYIA